MLLITIEFKLCWNKKNKDTSKLSVKLNLYFSTRFKGFIKFFRLIRGDHMLNKTKIFVLGAGYSGVHVAKKLGKKVQEKS